MKRHDIRRISARPDRSFKPGIRGRLTAEARKAVRKKTGGTCHVCGGPLGARWQADHVVPHKLGGQANVDNYLPVCKECNRLRWSHTPEVLRLILRLGTYAKNEIRQETKLGEELIALVLKRLRENRKRRGAKKGR